MEQSRYGEPDKVGDIGELSIINSIQLDDHYNKDD